MVHSITPRQKAIALATEIAKREIDKYLRMDVEERKKLGISPAFKASLLTLDFLENNRYLEPSLPKFRSPNYRDESLELSPRDFRDALRVTPQQFEYLVEMIKNHPIFLSHGRRRQEEVAIQLKVALHRLGHDGSLSSYSAIGRVLAVSTGSVKKYTGRCVIALCSMFKDVVKWPGPHDKTNIKRHFKETSGFSDAIGIIDGTMIPMLRAPSEDRNSWATRKSNFAMGATGVVDHCGVFTFFITGYVGSRHDSAAYKSSDLFLNTDRYFTGEDYMLGDAAYGLSPTLITRFKGRVDERQSRFNAKHSAARVKVEHAFGLLKGRFCSLKNLRREIRGELDVKAASHSILACVVLHNILSRREILDPNEDEMLVDGENNVEDDHGEDLAGMDMTVRQRGAVKRQRIMDEVLQRR